MSFFDNVYSETKKAVDVVGKFANDTVGVSKLRFAIANLKDRLDAKYKVLGMLYYRMQQGDAELEETIRLHVTEIELLHRQIDEKTAELQALKKSVRCAGCGTSNPSGADYCNKCGEKLS